MLWSGTAASAVDLNPAGFHDSTAVGVCGTQQVGFGNTPIAEQALLWNGTADSVVELTPAGSNPTEAIATDGHHQVGRVTISQGDGSYLVHAVMWSGTAASMVDLNPAGFSGSAGLGVGGDQQVGWIVDGNENHAALWTGRANSVVNLYPGRGLSYAVATNGRQQAGQVDNQAVVWNGTADSMVNLHSLLPAGNWAASSASSIDAQGNVFGIAYGISSNDGVPQAIMHAIEWQNVPEPTSTALLLVAAPLLLCRR